MRKLLAPLILGFLALPLEAQESERSLAQGLSKPAYEDLGQNQKLSPLFTHEPTINEWVRRRSKLRKRWEALLGTPSFAENYDRESEIIETFEAPDFRGTLLRQPTGPDTRQLTLVMEPKVVTSSPRPGAVVPFYHPDPMAGFDLENRERIVDKLPTQFGLHLVRQGYVVVCTEAFPYNTVPEPEKHDGLDVWRVAAEKLAKDHPHWTGMGKLVHDTRRGLDLLLEQANIDRERILLIGHSLGGKMAFYTACLDDRVKATIASDFGIGWDFTNWSDPWYLGDRILAEGFPLAHHQLLALHAPRPFLLIAGQYDKPESWQYLNAARPVYALYGREHALGMLDHASGHQPTEESMRTAYRWLAEQFGP
jgi:predicted esterase